MSLAVFIAAYQADRLEARRAPARLASPEEIRAFPLPRSGQLFSSLFKPFQAFSSLFKPFQGRKVCTSIRAPFLIYELNLLKLPIVVGFTAVDCR